MDFFQTHLIFVLPRALVLVRPSLVRVPSLAGAWLRRGFFGFCGVGFRLGVQGYGVEVSSGLLEGCRFLVPMDGRATAKCVWGGFN